MTSSEQILKIDEFEETTLSAAATLPRSYSEGPNAEGAACPPSYTSADSLARTQPPNHPTTRPRDHARAHTRTHTCAHTLQNN
mmetsp:Transcript_7406/g.16198  ORF Transcript_7406/g.16198 Transcript_7406/m.16198 type:complete len:83 (+) Transcript_7406:144-392(+)